MSTAWQVRGMASCCEYRVVTAVSVDAKRPLRVGWKTASLSAHVASVRYRALLPMLALTDAGIESVVFCAAEPASLDDLDVLVIVKSLTALDIQLAQSAAERGIHIVFDLCDNIFIAGYGAKGAVDLVQVFQAIAAHVDCIVTTTDPLAATVREIVPGIRVEVIPDGIETPELVRRGVQLLQQAQQLESARRLRRLVDDIRLDIKRIRKKGPRAILPLGKSYMKRLLRALRERLRMASLPALPAASLASDLAPLRIVWFGNHGAPHARFGMLDLLEIREALETVAREFPVELVVISNNRQKYEDNILPLAIASRYVEWSPQAVERWLEGATVAVVPNTLDPFSICKSANRTVLAVTRGVPVVATPTPALQQLADCVHLGEPLSGLRRYLGDRQAGVADAAEAAMRARQEYGQLAISRYWMGLLSSMLAQSPRTAATPPDVIIVLDLIQDLDLALPVMEALRRQSLGTEAWCSASLMQKSPRVLAVLRERNIAFRIMADESTKDMQFPARARVLMTVAETNLGPHRFSRQLSEQAISRGLFVCTMQHGFENVGLTYSDAVHDVEHVNIVAQRIYTWGPFSTMHPSIPAGVLGRCVPVGCPKPALSDAADLSALIDPVLPVIGVFENLHWHRYDDNYRADFLAGMSRLADAFPAVCFLIKPHHAGLWLTRRYQGGRPVAPNLIIADPQSAAWERYTASALLGRMTAVITTPSTVALDAARRGLPVAVVAGGLALPNYMPLPLIRHSEDWVGFVQGAMNDASRQELVRTSVAFVERTLVQGDAAARIASDLAAIGGR